MKWQAPEIEVAIGSRSRTGTVRKMEIEAARGQPVASVYLDLSNLRFEWQDGALDRDQLVLKWGWRGQKLAPLFGGTVLRSQLRETLQIWGLCSARQLMDTRLTRTYQDEEARVIVEHLLSGMEFASLKLADCTAILDKLPLFNNTAVEAIAILNRRLSLDNAFFCDPEGNFYWGQRDEDQESVAVFAEGEDVIDFRALPGGSFLLTVMGSPIWHSQVISILDSKKNEKRYFVEQIRHTAGVSGSGLRSILWLSEASDG